MRALLLTVLVMILSVGPAWAAAPTPTPAVVNGSTLSYGDLLEALEGRQVRSVVIDAPAASAEVLLSSGQRKTAALGGDDADLAQQAHDAGANVIYTSPQSSAPVQEQGSPWLFMLIALLGMGAVAVVANTVWARRRRASGSSEPRDEQEQADHEAGQRMTKIETPQTRFIHVAGCDEAIEELREVLDFLRSPGRYRQVGAKMPSGAILHGPPGTGKTLLAKALAGEAGLPFFTASGSDFVEKYVGTGAKRVRKLFEEARASERGGIIFIDEIDAVGRSRAGSGEQAHEEREQTLNALLVELDGFQGLGNIFVLAATNRLDILDDALLRPGRLAHQIRVDPPGPLGRRRLFEIYLHGKPLHADVDLDQMAASTGGLSGADIEDLCNRAAIFCARHRRSSITMADLDEGHLWALAGPEKKEATFAPGEEAKVAWHEAGHVLCAELSPTHENSHRVTIKPRGQAGGLAKYAQVDRMLHDLTILHDEMVCLLGGRAAEKERFGVVSSGAQNDLQRVMQIARAAVSELALVEGMGQVLTNQREMSEMQRQRVEHEVEQLVAAAWRDAQRVVHEHRVSLDALAEALLAQKELFRVDIVAAMQVDLPTPPAPSSAMMPAPVPTPVLPPHEREVRVRMDDDDPKTEGHAVARPTPAPITASST